MLGDKWGVHCVYQIRDDSGADRVHTLPDTGAQCETSPHAWAFPGKCERPVVGCETLSVLAGALASRLKNAPENKQDEILGRRRERLFYAWRSLVCVVRSYCTDVVVVVHILFHSLQLTREKTTLTMAYGRNVTPELCATRKSSHRIPCGAHERTRRRTEFEPHFMQIAKEHRREYFHQYVH